MLPRILVLLLALSAVSATAGDAAPPLPGRIVFASNRGPNVNNAEIFSVRVDGSRLRNLSRNQGADHDPVLSPDGRRVAFWAERFEEERLVRALYVMGVDGSRQRRLTPEDLAVAPLGERPTWSHDGTRIAFVASSGGQDGIWLVRADGSGLTLVAWNGSEPDWSPRAGLIAFRDYEVGSGIALVNADGSGRRTLTDSLHPDGFPVWAPDGRSLLFVRFPTRAPPVLHRIGVDGSGLTPLAPIHVDLVGTDMNWSPNGRQIVFNHASAVWVVSPDGSGLRRLTLGSDPAYSPNGRRIAFVRGSALNVMNADGSGRRKVREAKGDFFTSGPTWSPDGRSLLYASVREGGDHELYVVNPDGSRMRQLTRNSLDERLPVWSPARRRIAFVVGRDVFIMSASGTGRRRLTRGSYPTWSPTGTEIAFSRDGSVYVVATRGGTPKRLAPGSRPAWSPRGSQIAFVRGFELVALDPRSRAERVVADLDCDARLEEDTIVGIPEWSPDGRRLIVALKCIVGRAEFNVAFVVNADGSGRRFLPHAILDFARLAWSPDGLRIAFSSYSGYPRIATAMLDGSRQATVTSGAGDDRDVDW